VCCGGLCTLDKAQEVVYSGGMDIRCPECGSVHDFLQHRPYGDSGTFVDTCPNCYTEFTIYFEKRLYFWLALPGQDLARAVALDRASLGVREV